MLTNRIMIAVLSLTIFSATHGVAAQAAKSGNGPAFAKWAFTGKDNTGLVWTGTLDIAKLDPARFDATKYHSMCSLEVESTDSNKGTVGVEAPCIYDPATRALSFSIRGIALHSYTAVLSADGRSLTQGKWTESAKGPRKNGQPGATVVTTGVWSAKFKP
jgi:hypothetical protein